MENILLAHVPRDLARMIRGYVEIFQHPIIPGQCPVCRTCVGFELICGEHRVCILCLEIKDTGIFHVCDECFDKHDALAWIQKILHENVFVTCFRDDEVLIDIPRVSKVARLLMTRIKECEYWGEGVSKMDSDDELYQNLLPVIRKILRRET